MTLKNITTQLPPPPSFTKLAITIAFFCFWFALINVRVQDTINANALDTLEEANNLNSIFLHAPAIFAGIFAFAVCVRWCIYAPVASWTLVYWLSPIFLAHYAWFALQRVWLHRQTVVTWVWWSLKMYIFLLGGWFFYYGWRALKHCSAEASKWNVESTHLADGHSSIKWHNRETGQILIEKKYQQKQPVRVVAKKIPIRVVAKRVRKRDTHTHATSPPITYDDAIQTVAAYVEKKGLLRGFNPIDRQKVADFLNVKENG